MPGGSGASAACGDEARGFRAGDGGLDGRRVRVERVGVVGYVGLTGPMKGFYAPEGAWSIVPASLYAMRMQCSDQTESARAWF
jgi:hypothetical protein